IPPVEGHLDLPHGAVAEVGDHLGVVADPGTPRALGRPRNPAGRLHGLDEPAFVEPPRQGVETVRQHADIHRVITPRGYDKTERAPSYASVPTRFPERRERRHGDARPAAPTLSASVRWSRPCGRSAMTPPVTSPSRSIGDLTGNSTDGAAHALHDPIRRVRTALVRMGNI